MKAPLHPWNVTPQQAIRIQKTLAGRVVLRKTFSKVESIGGADAAYSQKGEAVGAIVILSFPDMEILETATATKKSTFPYIPGLLSFREGPVLIKAFEKLDTRPDVLILEGQGLAHSREFGLASHLGLWLNLSTVGCTKTPLLKPSTSVGTSKGDFQYLSRDGEKVGVVLRTKHGVKPVFVSPGHLIDLETSIQLIPRSCTRFRMPQPLRLAHQVASAMRAKSQSPNLK